MEPNENMFLSQALHPLRKKLLHTKSSHHASLHFFRTNISNVFVDSNCIFLKLHGGPRSSLIKQDEGKSQEGDIKGGFVRRVFDPGENQNPPLSPRTAALYAMMNNRFEALQRRIDQIRIEGESRDHENRKRRRRRRERHDDGDPRAEDHGGMRREETHVESVKVKVPQFVGLNNPEAYLKRELKIELLFEYHNYSKEKKVKVAASEFKEYAMVWWDQYQKDRRRSGDKLIDTWEDMKDVMRRRYAPNSYKKGNPNKLQSRPKFITKKVLSNQISLRSSRGC
ncbi:hypothetical protein Lal_00043539 [Lupinus albus]|nr:hypothetical protein Lal_00043539 [Lupinus albus]